MPRHEPPPPDEIPSGFIQKFCDDEAPVTPVKVIPAVITNTPAPHKELQVTNAPPALRGGIRVQISAKTKAGKIKWSTTLWVFAASVNKDAVMLMLPADYPTLECEAGTALSLTWNGQAET